MKVCHHRGGNDTAPNISSPLHCFEELIAQSLKKLNAVCDRSGNERSFLSSHVAQERIFKSELFEIGGTTDIMTDSKEKFVFFAH